MAKGRPERGLHAWTPEEDEWLRDNVPGHGERWLIDGIKDAFGWDPTVSQVASRKTKLGLKSGTHGGRFEKGHATFNKGKRQTDFMSAEAIERTKATRFQVGHVPERRDGWIKDVGFERISKDGYVEVKVNDGLQNSANKNYRKKHHVEYERHHGPIPDGCNVVFADKDKRNFAPENLVAVPRSLWAHISHAGIEYHDRQSLEAAIALARLNKAVKDVEFRPRKCAVCGNEFQPPKKNNHVNMTCPDCIASGRRAGKRKI